MMEVPRIFDASLLRSQEYDMLPSVTIVDRFVLRAAEAVRAEERKLDK